MSLFTRDPRSAIEAELTKLRSQRDEAQAKLDTAQQAADISESVAACEKSLAIVSSMTGVLASLDSRIATAERKLADIDRAPLLARRDELQSILARDLTGFEDDIAALSKAELDARIALGRTHALQSAIITKARALHGELRDVQRKLGEPASEAATLDGPALHVVRRAVVTQLLEYFANDRDGLLLARTGLEHECLLVQREASDKRIDAHREQQRHDPRTPAHLPLPGLAPTQPGAA